VRQRHAQATDVDSNVPLNTPRRIVVGIGLNVNNPANTAPHDVQKLAIALCDVSSRRYDLTDVLGQVLAALAVRLDQLQRGDSRLPRAWKSRSLLTNKHVQLNVGQQVIEGYCAGIDKDGSLVLRMDRRREKIASGVVMQVR
jgi:BirA family biotin operon repressor/biotin-[acetyl-CoA-carboxylase] ligase